MAEGPYFQKNLTALRKLNAEQADAIMALTPKVEHRLYTVSDFGNGFANFSLKTASNGLTSLFVTADPALELSRWLDSTELKQEPVHAVLLLGLGLGFEVKKLLECLSKNSIIAVVEPDPYQFFTTLHHVDVSDLLGSNRIHFYVGQGLDKTVESIGVELQWPRFMALPYRILVTSLMRRLRPDFARQFTSLWRDALQREWMYRRSRVTHGETVVINTIANADLMIASPGVSGLFHQFQGVPAVLAAAGPSLEKSLDAMKQVQNNVLIACVNTAYPVLRKNGIRPHIVFAMDHSERNVRSFEGDTPDPETYLIADPRVHPRIIRHFYPRVFMASWRSTTEKLGEPAPLDRIPVPRMSGNAIYLWLQSLAGGKGDVYGPGSVAVVGFHILARLGCQPMVLVGQDLAFTDQKTYADGTIFDDKALPRNDEISHVVPSVNGGSVPTSETLHLYRKLLEHEIARFKISVFNTSSGAAISGAITTRLETITPDLLTIKVDVAGQMALLHQSFVPSMDNIDLRRVFQDASRLLHDFSDRAKSTLDLLPPDPDHSLTEKDRRALLKKLEDAVASCTQEHKQALELMNELLQETHFEFEDSRWHTLLQENESTILNEKLRNHARILDAFIKQSGLLITMIEEKLERLDF